MKITGIEINVSKLFSKDELLQELKENGESDNALVPVRNRYYEEFGNELIWYYPLSDGDFSGCAIVVVKEGFLRLPYDYIEKFEHEIFEPESAMLLDKDHFENFIENWKKYSDDLMNAFGDMLNIVKEK